MIKDDSKKNDNITLIIATIIQVVIFYIFPVLFFKISPFGMVISILFATFVLSLILGIISNRKTKYFYPIIISIIFIPSVYIFYNSSALIHAIWYLIVSYIGLLIGITVKKIISSNQ